MANSGRKILNISKERLALLPFVPQLLGLRVLGCISFPPSYSLAFFAPTSRGRCWVTPVGWYASHSVRNRNVLIFFFDSSWVIDKHNPIYVYRGNLSLFYHLIYPKTAFPDGLPIRCGCYQIVCVNYHDAILSNIRLINNSVRKYLENNYFWN